MTINISRICVIAALFLAASQVDAASFGQQFRINQTTPLNQRLPAVAQSSNGTFVVVWEAEVQDGGAVDIFARRFGADGSALGPDIKVNNFTTNRQGYASVAINASGRFVVGWDSNGQASTGLDVYGRSFNADGSPRGAEFQVNNDNKYSATARVAVAIDDAGNSVFVWPERDSLASVATTARRAAINARLYDSNGKPRGRQFEIETVVGPNLRIPNVAMAADGSFVAAWHQDTSEVLPIDGVLTATNKISARRYTAAGKAVGKTVTINEPIQTTLGQLIGLEASAEPDQFDRPSLAVAPNGSFVVAWQRNKDDLAPLGVFARRFDAANQPQGGEFRVGTATDGLEFPSVAMEPSGAFTIAGHGGGVFAQRYNAGGSALGGLERIDSSQPDYALVPALAGKTNGRVVMVWQDFGSNGDGDGRGIAARLANYP